jgi:hypothetical protein
MKTRERARARQLRAQGLSLNEIYKIVPAAKSTISLWVRDIPLTHEQITALKERSSHRGAARERFVNTMRVKRDARWADFYAEAEREFSMRCNDPSFMFGLALYIGEGSKAYDSRVEICNCNPGVIRKSLEFFYLIGIRQEQVKCRVHLHQGLDANGAIDFWKEQTGLCDANFGKIVIVISKSSQCKKGNRLPYGTCHLGAHSVKISQKLKRWMELALED